AKQKIAAATVAANVAASTPPMPVGPTGKKTFVPKSAEDPLAKAAGVRPAAAVTPESAKALPVAPPPPKPDVKPAPAPKPAETKTAAPESPPAARPAPAAAKLQVNIVKPEETKKAKVALPQSDDANYEFPPLSLLKEQVRPAADSDEEYKKNMADLVRILGEFDVDVAPGEIHVGPVITRYELVPAPGVRVEKISGLDKNIALGL